MENKYSYVLFDLDGTVTDPEEGITKSVQYALQHFSIEVQERRELYKFIGPPLKDSFMEFYGFTEQQAGEALLKYRERFEVTGWRENVVYDGMEKLLRHLRRRGKRIMLATSKPEVFAEQILVYFGLRDYFDFVGGASLDGRRNYKADVIRYVLDANGISSREKAVMVGDRKFDILGAKEFGLETVGVLYGYGDREELTTAGADHLVGSVAELEALLCS
ncbi:MAG: HAD family hydrolase [Odoribacter splanchnicus]|nr:HAD family hydrolase [Odoribacter splanchnicus]